MRARCRGGSQPWPGQPEYVGVIDTRRRLTRRAGHVAHDAEIDDRQHRNLRVGHTARATLAEPRARSGCAAASRASLRSHRRSHHCAPGCAALQTTASPPAGNRGARCAGRACQCHEYGTSGRAHELRLAEHRTDARRPARRDRLGRRRRDAGRGDLGIDSSSATNISAVKRHSSSSARCARRWLSRVCRRRAAIEPRRCCKRRWYFVSLSDFRRRSRRVRASLDPLSAA